MQEFMVEFSQTMNGERKYLREIICAETAQEAVNDIRLWTDDCAATRIEKVYRGRNRRWEETEAWE